MGKKVAVYPEDRNDQTRKFDTDDLSVFYFAPSGASTSSANITKTDAANHGEFYPKVLNVSLSPSVSTTDLLSAYVMDSDAATALKILALNLPLGSQITQLDFAEKSIFIPRLYKKDCNVQVALTNKSGINYTFSYNWGLWVLD